MRKIVGLILLLCTAVLGLFYLEEQKNKVLLVDGRDCPVAIEISYDMGKIHLEPWFDSEKEVWYVFFPSYITHRKINLESIQKEDLLINGKKANGSFQWENEDIYQLTYKDM